VLAVVTDFLFLLLAVLFLVWSVGTATNSVLNRGYKARLTDSPSMPPISRPIDPDAIARNTTPLLQRLDRLTAKNPTARAMVAEMKETGDIASRRSDEGSRPRGV
jgi:hypothetical protein